MLDIFFFFSMGRRRSGRVAVRMRMMMMMMKIGFERIYMWEDSTLDIFCSMRRGGGVAVRILMKIERE